MATGDRTVVGFLVGLEPRNGGWMRFSIQEQGRQYPVKADTKKPDIIAQCQALMGQLVQVQLNEQPSTNINPHSGQPYVNRYLNAISFAQPGAATPQPMPQGAQPSPYPQPTMVQPQPTMMQPMQVAQNGPQPTQEMVTRDAAAKERARELRIMRQAAAKVSVSMMWAIPEAERTPVAAIEAAEMWVAYFVYGPTRFGVAPFNAAPEGAQQALVEAAQANADPDPIADPVDEQPTDGSMANVNTSGVPCPSCGAAPGQLHADDCLPY